MSRRLSCGMGALLLAVASAGAQEVSVSPLATPLEDIPAQAPVKDFQIVGNHALADAEIERRLFTEESSGFLFFAKTKRMNKEEFLDDLRRIVVLYQQNGYFDADVTGYTARLRDDGGVELAIHVVEGEPTAVDSLRVVVEGPRDTLESHDDPTPEQLLQRIPLKQGDVFNEAKIDSSQAILTAEFQNRGHAFAEVLREYAIRKDERSAAVTFTIYPGEVYHFGDVTIEGETSVSQKLIRGQVQFGKGDLFRLDRVYDTQRRLYQLNLFRRVQVEPQYDAAVADTLPVGISVADADEHLVRLGLGYGTEDFFRASASWLDRNFLGGARQARLAAEYSSRRRGGTASLTQPNVLVDDLSATATGFFGEELEDSYDVRRLGGTARITHEISGDLRSYYGLNIERDDFLRVDEDVQGEILGPNFINPSTLSYVEFGLLLDDTDDLFSPTRGMTAHLDYHLANTVLTGDYQYHRLTLLVTKYVEVRDGWVLAFKVLPGVLEPYGSVATDGDSAVVAPLFERLFSGGSTSVRGYQRRRLGPLAGEDCENNFDDCDPIGGEALLEGSAELRFPLFGNFRGVAFVDAGNVWLDRGDVSLSELRYTPGVGVRYATPIGPVRFDVGFKTNGDDPGPGMVLHFSIGNAF